MVLVLSIINVWSTRQVDFIISFPQDEIEFDMYRDITQGTETKGGSSTSHVLKLLKNIYGQRQGYQVWNQQLTKGIEEIRFIQSRVNDCKLYQREVIFIVYVDNGIFVYPRYA